MLVDNPYQSNRRRAQMAKKFGTFGGVFTPSILTILGVIMYMRLGWVVGNAGLYGTIIIIVIAHVISVTTGLSISSIATDKKVGAGGVYYVLSRSLGLPIGGAIGVTLFSATALSIALYLVGFAESFNAYLGLDTSINGLRIGGTIALALLATIALISTAVAIKTQYFILAAIGISLVSIFWGTREFAPTTVHFFGSEDSVPLETIFAIFFPAVTGFTAGIAMSGDLADPKKSIPVGTISAIAVGFIVYIALAVFIAFSINPEVLKTDYNVLMKIALFAPAVVAGIWGATLSSALGGILGGPRILQAMSIDKITPKLFGKGFGKEDEPRNALFITLIIAECGILIGELDLIARVVSMFYLAAYGFINLSFFLESWASADFSPSFKVKKWIGLVGFVASFAVMFKLDMFAMFAAFVIIGGIYAFLQRREIALGSGDIWYSVWSSLVQTGLKKMDKGEDVKRNWKPNILLFSGSTETRPHLIEIAKGIAGKVGMVSNFHLVENPDAKILFPKHKQALQDPILTKNGIFGRQQEVRNVYEGIETIASTYGFSGVVPNTVMLGWAKNTKDPLMFAQMTQKLIELDYNVLYLDYDWNKKFGKYQRIDIWWRNLKNNAELTLNIAKFISISPEWQKARIRLILINDTNKEGFERIIHQQLETFRIDASIKVINNFFENRSSFDLMKNNSQDADLIIAGIPDIPEGEEKDFVDNTTEMFGVLGTTLLVKTSSILGEDETTIAAPAHENAQPTTIDITDQLIPLLKPQSEDLQEWIDLVTQEIENQSVDIAETEIASFQNIYQALINECRNDALEILNSYLNPVENNGTISHSDLKKMQRKMLKSYQSKIDHFAEEDLAYLEERIEKLHQKFISLPDRVLSGIPKKVKVEGKKILLARIFKHAFIHDYPMTLQNSLLHIGSLGYELSESIKNTLIQSIQLLTDHPDNPNENIKLVEGTFDDAIGHISNQHLALITEIRNKGRKFINSLVRKMENKQDIHSENAKSKTLKELRSLASENATYQDYWLKNETCFINRLATDIKLQQVNLTVEQIGTSLQEEIDQSMFGAASARLREAEEWLDSLKDNSVNHAVNLPEVNQSLAYDDQKIEELLNSAELAGRPLPEQLELIDPDSLHRFSKAQGEEVQLVVVNARATYNYLIHHNLQKPLQKQLLTTYQGCMELLSLGQYDLIQIAQKINQLEDQVSPEELLELKTKAKSQIHKLRKTISENAAEQRDVLYDIIHTANSSLNTGSLLDHAVRILPAESSDRTGIRKWLGDAGDKAEFLVDKYGNLISSQRELIKSKQRDQLSLEQNKKDVHYELKKFVDNLKIAEDVANRLPFYYKQLFIGKPAASIDQLHFRKDELRQAFTMLKSPNSDEHAIIVLGEPLSGKSFFSEAVARKVSKGNMIKIQPPASGSCEVKDLVNVLEKQIRSFSQSDNIFKDAPKGTVFLFDDLELWWDRSRPDGKLIRFIINIVNKYKSRYSFILNCNSYAFNIMERQGLLEFLTASRIHLSHFNQPALEALLLERHESGGLRLNIVGGDHDQISRKNKQKLMSRFLQSSRGIVGIALHQWISNICGYENELVEIDFPKEHSFPQQEDKEWLIILSQFLIHKHLDAARLQTLFGYEDRAHADKIISQLSADGVIQDIMGSTYKINPIVLVWIMNQAEEFKLI